MTNQASELFELCKKVYELTEWQGDFLSNWGWVQAHGEYEVDNGCTDGLPPLYTSDYLLEKLPNKIKGKHSTGWLTLSPMDKETWGAGYEADHTEHIDDYKFEWADTPLLALLKLTIVLSEAGELK